MLGRPQTQDEEIPNFLAMITFLKRVTESKQHLREDNCYCQLNMIQSSIHWSIWVRPCGHRVSLCGQYKVSRSFPLGQAWAPWSFKETQKGIALRVKSHWQPPAAPLDVCYHLSQCFLGAWYTHKDPRTHPLSVSPGKYPPILIFWFSTLWASPFLWSVQLFLKTKPLMSTLGHSELQAELPSGIGAGVWKSGSNT